MRAWLKCTVERLRYLTKKFGAGGICSFEKQGFFKKGDRIKSTPCRQDYKKLCDWQKNQTLKCNNYLNSTSPDFTGNDSISKFFNLPKTSVTFLILDTKPVQKIQHILKYKESNPKSGQQYDKIMGTLHCTILAYFKRIKNVFGTCQRRLI